VLDSVLVSLLNCQSRGWGLISRHGRISFEISAPRVSLAPPNSAIMSILTVYCLWEDEMVRERTGHIPSYAEAKKMKLLTFQSLAASGLA